LRHLVGNPRLGVKIPGTVSRWHGRTPFITLGLIGRGRVRYHLQFFVIHPRHLAAAVMVHQPVMGQAIEPGLEKGLDPVCAPDPDQIRPDVLKQFLGDGGVAATLEQIAIEGAAMAVVKGGEGLGVAIPIAQHQLFVRGFGHDGYLKQRRVIATWRLGSFD
jgi:hypothetical protein